MSVVTYNIDLISAYNNARSTHIVNNMLEKWYKIASKEVYPIVRQSEKNNGQKSASESSKMREKQILGP